MSLVAKALHEESITVHTTTKKSQCNTIDNLYGVPFIEYFNVKYAYTCKRASPLTETSCNNANIDRNKCNTLSAFFTPETMKCIFTERDCTVLQSKQFKEQRMLWVITNSIMEHSSEYHITAHHGNKSAFSMYKVFTIKELNNMKSVNATAFMVPHEAFSAIFPKAYLLNHVYWGPDAAMLNRSVTKIGKHKSCTSEKRNYQYGTNKL